MTQVSTLAPVGASPRNSRVTQSNVLKSEWVKFRTVRSSVYTTLVAVVLMVGLGLLFSFGEESRWAQASVQDKATFDPALVSLRGLFLAQLAVGTLGVLIISGEYATGMVRATFAAVPRRLPVLWAKLAVFGFAAFVTMTVAAFAAFGGGQAILHAQHIGTSLTSAGVLRQVLGAGLYLCGVGLLGVAIGTILRSTAAAIATLFGLLLVLPIMANFLPSGWDTIAKYLPSNAGQTIMSLHQGANSLSAGAGFALFCGYIAVAVVGAAITLRRRDV